MDVRITSTYTEDLFTPHLEIENLWRVEPPELFELEEGTPVSKLDQAEHLEAGNYEDFLILQSPHRENVLHWALMQLEARDLHQSLVERDAA